jgi:hypothetical protein
VSDSALDRLRDRLPEALRARLASEGPVDAWFETLGDDLPAVWIALEAGELEEVVGLLVEAGAESALVLRRLEELLPTKSGRKLARRGIHRLKSRGVAIEPAERASRPSVLKPLDEDSEQGLVTGPDPLGRRSLFLVAPVPGGARMYEIALSDVEGVVHLAAGEGKRRDARAFVRRVREQEEVRTVSVSGSAVRALVRRAPAAAERGRVDPKLLAEVVGHAEAETPGERVRAELEPAARELADREADELLRKCVETGALPPWPPVGPAGEELASQIEAIEHSPLVLSDAQKRERRGELIREHADRLLDAAYRDRVAARLEESAVLLLDSGDRAEALAAIQVAGRIREAQEALRVPFLELMLTTFLNAERERPEKRDPTRLILSS